MRRSKSLKLALVVNTLLLATLTWATIVDRPMASAVRAGGANAALPDAGSQRLEMIRELQRLNKSVRELGEEVKSLRSATHKVEVTRMPQERPAEEAP